MYKYTYKYTTNIHINMNISAAGHLRYKHLHVRRECDT